MLASVVIYKLIEHNNHITNQPSICLITTSNSSFDSLPLNAIAEKIGLDTSTTNSVHHESRYNPSIHINIK